LAQFGVTGCVLNVREAITRHRKRRKRGLFVRPIIVTKDQLDQLEVRGYLDPDLRGNRIDEVDAIVAFLSDSLVKESVQNVGSAPASAPIGLSPSVSSRESSLRLAGLPNPPSSPFPLRWVDKIRARADCHNRGRAPTVTWRGPERSLMSSGSESLTLG
jgi:hypothetical protein